jgi:hypothetical protein
MARENAPGLIGNRGAFSMSRGDAQDSPGIAAVLAGPELAGNLCG